LRAWCPLTPSPHGSTSGHYGRNLVCNAATRASLSDAASSEQALASFYGCYLAAPTERSFACAPPPLPPSFTLLRRASTGAACYRCRVRAWPSRLVETAAFETRYVTGHRRPACSVRCGVHVCYVAGACSVPKAGRAPRARPRACRPVTAVLRRLRACL